MLELHRPDEVFSEDFIRIDHDKPLKTGISQRKTQNFQRKTRDYWRKSTRLSEEKYKKGEEISKKR
jgi:hypothetical protein